MNTFPKAAYQFLRHLKLVKQSSIHTLRNYSIDLNTFLTFLIKEWHPELLPKEHPEKIHYNTSFQERNPEKDALLLLSPIDRKLICTFIATCSEHDQKRTIARRLATLRSFFSYVCRQQWLQDNPTEEIPNPKLDKPLPTSLQYEQVLVTNP